MRRRRQGVCSVSFSAVEPSCDLDDDARPCGRSRRGQRHVEIAPTAGEDVPRGELRSNTGWPSAATPRTLMSCGTKCTVPVLATVKCSGPVTHAEVAQRRSRRLVGRPHEDRDAHLGEHANRGARGGLAGRRQFLDEDAVGLLARRRAPRCCRRESGALPSASASAASGRRRRPASASSSISPVAALLPGERGELEPQRLGAVVAQRQQRARRPARQKDLRRVDAERRRGGGIDRREAGDDSGQDDGEVRMRITMSAQKCTGGFKESAGVPISRLARNGVPSDDGVRN